MAINKNHEFEDLNGIKCAIVEKKAPEARVRFLKDLLEFNRYTVILVETPVAAKPAPAKEGEATEPPPAEPPTYTIGVTDVTFNPTNAIFGRLLRTRKGRVVTLAYWQQTEGDSPEEIPYYEKTLS